jgi:hypothetical protein
MMEAYRIEPITREERTYDGVYLDSLGAWIGNVVRAQYTSGQDVTVVELAMNTTGGRIPAPAHWRELIIKRCDSKHW